jgi:hypothetical protein
VWIVGHNGTIFKPTDGGNTWFDPPYRRYPAPFSWLFLAGFFVLSFLSHRRDNYQIVIITTAKTKKY